MDMSGLICANNCQDRVFRRWSMRTWMRKLILLIALAALYLRRKTMRTWMLPSIQTPLRTPSLDQTIVSRIRITETWSPFFHSNVDPAAMDGLNMVFNVDDNFG